MHHLRPTPRPLPRVVALLVLSAALLVGAALPAGALLTGIDVASYQHPTGQPIDWGQVRAAGHSYAFVKATEGVAYTNPWFARDWAGAGAAGLYRGAYHYARPDRSSGAAQASYFVAATGSMAGATDLPPVLDLEETGGLGPADLAAWTRDFLATVTQLTGRAPIIYVGYYFWRDSVGAPADIAAQYRLWLPSYPLDPSSTTFRPSVPAGWATWTFWQYTSTGSVPGIVGDVDVNRFCCDVGTLAGLGGGGSGGGNPFGTLEGSQRLPGAALVSGWAIDPDSTGPVTVHVYVDGVYAGQGSANLSRPDVGAAFPGFGNNHGYAVQVPVPAGAGQACAYAINTGPGTVNTLLGCTSLAANPFGNFEAASSDANAIVTASGWAIDADAPQPLTVHLYVDGRFATAVTSSVPRPDVQAAYPGSGPTQGFSAKLYGLPAGRRTVCAYAINIGSGTTNTLLGCRPVDVPGVNPVGTIDSFTPALGGVRLQGWALDFSTPDPIDVHVYVDGAFNQVVKASAVRNDIAAFFGVSPNHGIDATIVTGTGRHSVCAFAINVGAGSVNPVLGCTTVDVPANPTGNLESVTRSGGAVTLSGWAIDPDTAAPIDVHVYVDGGWGGMTTASLQRPDVAWFFPAYGAQHGFSLTVPVAPGPHTVCAYAINVGPGTSNPVLGCQSV